MNTDEIAASIEGHHRPDLALRDSLVEKGIPLNDPKGVELHFWSTEQRDAALLARALYQSGFLVLVLAPNKHENGSILWNVEAGIKEPIERIISPEFTERMVRIAAEHSSEFDGWGTSL